MAMPHFLLRKLDVIEPWRVILTGYDVSIYHSRQINSY